MRVIDEEAAGVVKKKLIEIRRYRLGRALG
jgi:hypothetical protein